MRSRTLNPAVALQCDRSLDKFLNGVDKDEDKGGHDPENPLLLECTSFPGGRRYWDACDGLFLLADGLRRLLAGEAVPPLLFHAFLVGFCMRLYGL